MAQVGLDGDERVRRKAERDARERAQMLLAAASMLIWFVVSITFVVVFDLGRRGRASPILLVGAAALAVAALPWLLYPHLVRALVARDPGAGG